MTDDARLATTESRTVPFDSFSLGAPAPSPRPPSLRSALIASAACVVLALQGFGCVNAAEHPAGCGKDSDCKGMRICDAHACMDPPSTVSVTSMQAPAPASAASTPARPTHVGPGF